MNSKSLQLLVEKRSRSVRACFEVLKSSSGAEVSYDCVKRGVEALVAARKVKPDALYSTTDRLWDLLDCDGTGEVGRVKFYCVCESVMERGSSTGQWAKPGSRPPNVDSLRSDLGRATQQQSSRRCFEYPLVNDAADDEVYRASLITALNEHPVNDFRLLRSFLNDTIELGKLGKVPQARFVREWSNQDKVQSGPAGVVGSSSSASGSGSRGGATMAKAAARADEGVSGNSKKPWHSPRINRNSTKLSASNLRREEQTARQLAMDLGESTDDLDNAALRRSIEVKEKGLDRAGRRVNGLSYEMSRRIQLHAEVKAKKIAVLQKQQQDRAMQGCTFSPDLSKTRASDARIHVRKVIGDCYDGMVALQDAKRAFEGRPAVLAKDEDPLRYNPGHLEFFTTAAVKSDMLDTSPGTGTPPSPADFEWAALGLFSFTDSDVSAALKKIDSGSTGEYARLNEDGHTTADVIGELDSLAAAVRVACRAAAGTPLTRTGFTAKVGTILQAVKTAKGSWEEPGKIEPFEFSLPTLSNECEQTRQVASSIIPIILANNLEVLVGGVRRVRVASGSVGLPVHERLYAKSKAPLRQPGTMEVPQRVLEDIAECTFSPTLPTRDPKNIAALAPGRGEPGAVVEIKGAKEHLERVKAGRQRDAEEEDIFAFNELRYQKAMTAYRREPEKAFKWPTDVRLQEKARNSATKREPLLTIDVELSKTLTAKISVREGDHPAELAAAFCLLYGLNGESKEALTLMVSENMRLNNVAEGEGGRDGDEAGVEGSTAGTGGMADSTCAATLDSAGFPSDDDNSQGGMRDPHALHFLAHPDNSDNDEDSETGGLHPNPMVQVLTLRALKEFEELEARTALSSSPADVPGSRLEPRSQAEAAPRQIIATQVLSRELLATSAGNDDQNRSPSLSELVGTASQDANKPHEKRHKSDRDRTKNADSAENSDPYSSASVDSATGRTVPGPSVPRLAEVVAREALDLKKLRDEHNKTSGEPKYLGGRKDSIMSTMTTGSSGDSLVSSSDNDEVPLDEAIYYDDYNESKVPHVRPSWAEGDGSAFMNGNVEGYTRAQPIEETENVEEEEESSDNSEGRFRGFSLNFPSPDSAAHEPQTHAHAEADTGAGPGTRAEEEPARPISDISSNVPFTSLGMFERVEEGEEERAL
jgi:hypothetical protein